MKINSQIQILKCTEQYSTALIAVEEHHIWKIDEASIHFVICFNRFRIQLFGSLTQIHNLFVVFEQHEFFELLPTVT